MQIFNNTSVKTNTTNVKSKSKTRSTINSASRSSDAVRVFIDPSTINSKEYKTIQKENNSFPIYNPNVLLYDEQLNLYTYEKL